MMAKKFLIPFILASLTGHALIIVLTAGIEKSGGPRSEKVMNVELKMPMEMEPPPISARAEPAASAARTAETRGYREDSVALQNPGGPYESYLLQIRRKIEGLWSYPPQALSEKREGNAVIRFTIDAGGALAGYYVTSSSGSPVLDEGALAVIRAASPFAALPAAFHLSRLHVTATFCYRLGN
jgi:periplasmic protein TonB